MTGKKSNIQKKHRKNNDHEINKKPLNKKQLKRKMYYVSMIEKKKKVKTAICKYFIFGSCKMDDCLYSHDVGPDQMKKFDEMCKYYPVGECTKGQMCCFMHETFPCQFYHSKFGNKCKKGNDCLFSHEPLTEEKAEILENHLKVQSNRGQVVEEKIIENYVPIQSNFGQSALRNNDLASNLNNENFQQNIFRESLFSNKLNETHENSIKNVKSENFLSGTETEDQHLDVGKENVQELYENFLGTLETLSQCKNNVGKFISNVDFEVRSDEENPLNNNIGDIDHSGKNSEKFNILENLASNLNNIPQFTKIDYSDSDCESIDFNKSPEHSLSVISNNKNKKNFEKDGLFGEHIETIDNTIGNTVVFINRIQNKNIKRSQHTDEVIGDKRMKIDLSNSIDTPLHDQIQELNTQNSVLIKRERKEKNETQKFKKKSPIGKRKMKPFNELPCDNRNISELTENKSSPLLNHSNNSVKNNIDNEIKKSFQISEIDMNSCMGDVDLFSQLENPFNNFNTSRSALELLGLDSKDSIDIDNDTNETKTNFVTKVETTLEKSQNCHKETFELLSNSGNCFMEPHSIGCDNKENPDNSTFSDSRVVELDSNSEQTEYNWKNANNLAKCLQNNQIDKNSQVSDNNSMSDSREFIWQLQTLALSSHLGYHQMMDINCYNLHHKFDDPRICNHPKALKQSVYDWLTS